MSPRRPPTRSAYDEDSQLDVLTSEDVTVGEAELEAGEGGQPTASTTAAGGATTTTGG